MQSPPPPRDRQGRKGPRWEDGDSGWENAPDYGSRPIRWWFWPLAAAACLAIAALMIRIVGA